MTPRRQGRQVRRRNLAVCWQTSRCAVVLSRTGTPDPEPEPEPEPDAEPESEPETQPGVQGRAGVVPALGRRDALHQRHLVVRWHGGLTLTHPHPHPPFLVRVRRTFHISER